MLKITTLVGLVCLISAVALSTPVSCCSGPLLSALRGGGAEGRHEMGVGLDAKVAFLNKVLIPALDYESLLLAWCR